MQQRRDKLDYIKQWTFLVCITLIISVIISIFTPKGRMAGFFKIIISLFIFISFVYPLKDFKASDINLPEEFVSEDYEDSEILSAQTMVELQIKNALKENGITGASVSVELKMKDEQIEISKLTVAVPGEYDKSQVKNIIFDKLSLNAEVIYLGQ